LGKVAGLWVSCRILWAVGRRSVTVVGIGFFGSTWDSVSRDTKNVEKGQLLRLRSSFSAFFFSRRFAASWAAKPATPATAAVSATFLLRLLLLLRLDRRRPPSEELDER
jgi:hypothetical protein